MQNTSIRLNPARRGRVAFAVQLAALGLMLLGIMQLPRHFGEHAVVGSNGAVIGWHG